MIVRFLLTLELSPQRTLAQSTTSKIATFRADINNILHLADKERTRTTGVEEAVVIRQEQVVQAQTNTPNQATGSRTPTTTPMQQQKHLQSTRKVQSIIQVPME
jgi:hypothetical protein